MNRSELAGLLSQPWAILPMAMQSLLSCCDEAEEATHVDTSPPITYHCSETTTATHPVALDMDDQDMPRQGSVVAVVPIAGVLTRHGMWGRGGMLDTGRSLAALDRNPAVGSIVLSVSSPGGTVHGTPELADIVRGIRDRGDTRITSIADGMMASAATWIGTAASSVVATRSTEVGSIGVLNAYTDFSEHLIGSGIKVDVIRRPDKKARFTGVEPMDDDMRQTLQDGVDAAYADFLDAMAQNRGVSVKDVEKKYGGGEVMRADEAVEVGLIDAILDTDQHIQGELDRLRERKSLTSRRGRRAAIMEAMQKG